MFTNKPSFNELHLTYHGDPRRNSHYMTSCNQFADIYIAATYLSVTIINKYKYQQFRKIADLVGINFSDFEIIYSKM